MRFKRTLLAISCGAMTAIIGCDSSSSSDDTGTYSNQDEAYAWDTSQYISKNPIPWNTNIQYFVFKDSRDTQLYRAVKIGNQYWMAENLNYKVDSSWWYKGSSDSGKKYGRLYTWVSAMNLADTCKRVSCSSQIQLKHQGICPYGWHIPTELEWNTLTNFIGGNDSAANPDSARIKLMSKSGWDNNDGVDFFGFRALPAGIHTFRESASGNYYDAGWATSFWGSSEYSDKVSAVRQDLTRFAYYPHVSISGKTDGISVRCIRN